MKKNFTVFGSADENTIRQMEICMAEESVVYGALMGDNHLGYSAPIGSVLAFRDAVSPSAVGYDIACGNLAARTNIKYDSIKNDISKIMDEIVKRISFGIGRTTNVSEGSRDPSDHILFEYPIWSEIDVLKPLKDKARAQLGTVGSGNHYVDIFKDEDDNVWVGVHFGSRGLGHTIATHFLKEGGGKDGIYSPLVVFKKGERLYDEYLQCMHLAGEYAYAGRAWVVEEVRRILGAQSLEEIHNHHNFAWYEEHYGENLWVVRKGATPAFPYQYGFVGGSMGENSVILRGAIKSKQQRDALYSTVHGAGRVLSRNQAAGKFKWKKGVKTKISDGIITQSMMDEWVKDRAKVELRGGGLDESPHCYKRLDEVLRDQGDTIEIMRTLTPVGVAMAGNEFDPYKD